jgi:hypothetical protein
VKKNSSRFEIFTGVATNQIIGDKALLVLTDVEQNGVIGVRGKLRLETNILQQKENKFGLIRWEFDCKCTNGVCTSNKSYSECSLRERNFISTSFVLR